MKGLVPGMRKLRKAELHGASAASHKGCTEILRHFPDTPLGSLSRILLLRRTGAGGNKILKGHGLSAVDRVASGG